MVLQLTDKLERSIQRGARAQTLLADPLIAEAKEHVEAEIWRLFKEASPQDAAAIQHIKAMQYFHGKYYAFWERAVRDGKLAEATVEAKKKSIRERIFG